MNLGGILNNDSPPVDDDQRPPHKERSASEASSASVHQRNSITNILNGDDTDTTTAANGQPAPEAPPMSESESTTTVDHEVAPSSSAPEPEPQPASTTKPKSTPSKPQLPSPKPLANDHDHNGNDSQSQQQSSQQQEQSSPQQSSHQQEQQFDEQGDPIDSGLAKIKQLKGKTRPRRYDTPPIWAQEWLPHARDEPPAPVGQQPGSILSDKRVFDYTKTHSVDLECSISGVIPAPSVSRMIAEWIFANFRDISEQNRQYVELELKFGTITDKRTSNRISIDVTTECIYTNHSEVYFEMEVAEPAFKEVQRYFSELESKYQDSGRSDRGRPRRKFSHLETDITDSFYQVERAKEHPKSIRVSKDNSLTPARYSAIEKQRISDLYIHCPASMYDLRLSLALEFPVPQSSIEPLIANHQPVLQREKKRSSWTHAPTVSRFDLTKVQIPKDIRGKSGRKLVEYTSNYEIEQEIDTNEVFIAMDKFNSGDDAYRFEELVEIFLNNARVINTVVTKLAR